MMTDQNSGGSPRPGGSQPLAIIALALAMAFQAGYNPDQIREVLSAVAVALVALVAVYILRSQRDG